MAHVPRLDRCAAADRRRRRVGGTGAVLRRGWLADPSDSLHAAAADLAAGAWPALAPLLDPEDT